MSKLTNIVTVNGPKMSPDVLSCCCLGGQIHVHRCYAPFFGGTPCPLCRVLLNGCKEKLSKTCWIGWKRSECNALSSGIFLAQFRLYTKVQFCSKTFRFVFIPGCFACIPLCFNSLNCFGVRANFAGDR